MRGITTQEVLRMKAALFVDAEVPRATQDEPLSSVVEKVKSHPDHTVLVVDAANRLVGMISDQDLLEALSNPELAQKIQGGEATAGDVMKSLTPNADTVALSSDDIEAVIAKLRGENAARRPFKVVPLVDPSGMVVGQVTRASIQRALDSLLAD